MSEIIKDIGFREGGGKNHQKRMYCLAKCDCGNTYEAMRSNVVSGKSSGCGCKIRKHGESYTKLYKKWIRMKERGNPLTNNSHYFNSYSEKGICVCDEWLSDFVCFKNWATQNGYKPDLQIDRINNDGNYEPDNCRWVTNGKNIENTRLIWSSNTTGYRGVKHNKRVNKYEANIKSGVSHYLGLFKTPEAAAMAYNSWVIINGTNHPLNVIKKLL